MYMVFNASHADCRTIAIGRDACDILVESFTGVFVAKKWVSAFCREDEVEICDR